MKPIIAALIIASTFSSVFAQYELTPMRAFPFQEFYGHTNSTYCTGDLNGDGFLDVVIDGDESLSTVSHIYFNNGDNSYSYQPINSGKHYSFQQHFMVDMNQDGISELYVLRSFGFETCFFEYKITADGEYVPARELGCFMGQFPEVHLIDLNMDGQVEVIGEASYGKIVLAYNADSLKFIPSNDYDFGTSSQLVFGDLNADGFKDIVSTDFFAGFYRFKFQINNGVNGFYTIFPTGLDSLHSINIATLNLDGNPLGDLVVRGINQSTSQIEFKVFVQNSLYDFERISIPILDTSTLGSKLTVKDLDDDQDDDLVLLQWEADPGVPHLMLENHLDGTLSEYNFPGINQEFITDIHFADVDADQQDELFLTYFREGQPINQLFKRNNSEYAALTENWLQVNTRFPKNFELFDFDGDGFDDIVDIRGEKETSIDVFSFTGRALKNTNGNFAFSPNRFADYTYSYFSQIFIGDLENDSDLDIIQNFNDPKVLVFKNDGNGYFTTDTLILSDNNRGNLYACDLNQDGQVEIITSSDPLSSIQIFENQGALNYSSVGQLSGSYSIERESFADYNNDGILDFIVRTAPGNFYVVLVDANFQATLGAQVYQNNKEGKICAGEFNGDSNMDFVYLTEDGGFLLVNDTNLNFTLAPDIQLNDYPKLYGGVRYSEVVDLDNDGLDDIVLGSTMIHEHALLDKSEFSFNGLLNTNGTFIYDDFDLNIKKYVHNWQSGYLNEDSIIDFVLIQSVDENPIIQHEITYYPEYFYGRDCPSGDTIMEIDVCDEFLTADSLLITESGTYFTMVDVGLGCIRDAQLTVNVSSANASVLHSGLDFISATQDSANYFWYRSCEDSIWLLDESDQTFYFPDSSEYFLIVEKNGCRDTSNCFSIDNSGLSEGLLNSIQIFPNPSSGIINVNTELTEFMVDIYTIDGKNVSSQDHLNGNLEMDLGHLPKGIYLVQVHTSTERVIHKVVLR